MKYKEHKAVWYVAHPVSGDHEGNARNAIAWIKWLVLNDPTRVYIAPWVAEVLAFSDAVMTPEFYDRVLCDDEEVVARLDGILLVGGRVSTGMARELEAARESYLDVLDLTRFVSPPADDTPEAEALRKTLATHDWGALESTDG